MLIIIPYRGLGLAFGRALWPNVPGTWEDPGCVHPGRNAFPLHINWQGRDVDISRATFSLRPLTKSRKVVKNPSLLPSTKCLRILITRLGEYPTEGHAPPVR